MGVRTADYAIAEQRAAALYYYFPKDDPKQTPHNSWRHTAHIYTNWIKALYEATPYNIEDIPRTF